MKSRFIVNCILLSAMLLSVVVFTSQTAFAATSVFINEIHYDNTSFDTGEFVEIAGPAGTDLTGWTLLLYNGFNGGVYNTIDLSGQTILDQSNGLGTFDIQLPSNGLQNGSPDGLALIDNGGNVIQFLSYEGAFTATDGPANGLTSTDIGVSEPGSTPIGDSLQLTGTGTMYEDFTWTGPIPGTAGDVNTGQTFAGSPPPPPSVIINEVDADTPGSDTAEFVELFGDANAALDGLVVVFYNGSSDTVYNAFDLDGFSTDANGYFVLGNSGVANVSITFPSNGLQNGADAVALHQGDAADFPNGTALTMDNLIDAIVYDTNDGDDAGLLALLNAGQPQVNEAGGANGSATDSSQRCANGTGGARNTDTFAQFAPSPGAENSCGNQPTTNLIINEVDADTPGSDTAEFVELFGDANAALDGLVVVFFNGSSDTVYNAFDLDGFSTDANGYFVLGNSGVANVSITFPSNGLQNGADAVALYQGDAADFPNGTALTTDNLIDAIVYDTNDGDDAGLLALLNAGQPQVNENNKGSSATDSSQRCANGTGGARNTDTYDQFAPSPGAENSCGTVTPGVTNAFIHEVQGSGPAVAINSTVRVTGTVVADYQAPDQLNGFFVQEEDSDADANNDTSEGIFVFCGSCTTSVNVGDKVEVVGLAEEFFDMSQIDVTEPGGSVTVISSGNPLPTASVVSLPASGSTEAAATFESLEGMLVKFTDELFVSEYFELARYGQLVLTADARPHQYTDANMPSVAGYAAFLDDLNSKRIILDDDNNDQNSALGTPDKPYFWPRPGLSTTNFIRGGDSISDLTGVLHWSWAGSSGTNAWRVRPVEGIDYTFTTNNGRPAQPADVGGTIKVASFNVLNYFTTLDNPGNTCGPNNLGCRGAHSAAELARQTEKTVAAICGADADIVGLVEIENNATQSLDALVTAVNQVCGPYDYINTGTIGGDAIKVGLIYKPATVSPVNAHAVLDSSVDPTFIDTKNRPVLIQTFDEVATGGRLTIAVNHLKSKGSPCDDVGDPGLNDGQANCSETRTAAAVALANYLATDPTSSDDPDFLIIGDLNSYRKEDPIMALVNAGYVDLIDSFGGANAYSYVFDGQLGYLDYVMSNTSLTPQVTGVTEWHINADEIPLFDYNDGIQDPNEASFERESTAETIYENNAFRASDHDPVIVGLNLDAPVSNIDIEVTITDSPDPLVAGENGGVDNLVHTITVKNNGPDDATNVIIQFGANTNPPPSLSFSQGAQGPAGNQWTIPALASGSSATLTFTFDIGEDYPLPNVSSSASLVSVDQTDTNSNNDSAAEDTTVTPPPIELERLIPDCFDVANDQYRWRVRNATDVELPFTLTNPAGDIIFAQGIAAPNGDTVVFTAADVTTNPTILRVDGVEQPFGRKNPNTTPCTPPLEKISPVLECVAPIGDSGMYRAFFGYNNPNGETVEIAVGPENKFNRTPQDQGQPTSFDPGRTPFFPDAAFSVDFDGSNLVWTLNGKTATASDNPVQRCNFYVELDKEWTGADAPEDILLGLITATSTAGDLTCDWDGTDLVCDGENLKVPVSIDENDELVGNYSVSEDGLPEGWNVNSGTGDFSVPNDNCDGKFCEHTVVNEKEILKLERLIPDCFDTETDQYRWRVRNPHDVEIPFTLTNPAGDVILAEGIAAPNGDTVVYTDETATTFPTILRVDGVEQPNGRKNPNVNPCAPTTGKITIFKQIDWGRDVDNAPDTQFNFSGDLGGFTLGDGESYMMKLPAGRYDITEAFKYNWELGHVTCDSGDTRQISHGVRIDLEVGDDITCTFVNEPNCVEPRADLSATITWDGDMAMGHVTNDSDALCSWDVGMASYEKYNEVIDEQDIFDWTDGVNAPPGETIKMTIGKPACAVQIDVFFGEVLLSLDGQRYGHRLLAYQHLHQDGYCERPMDKVDGYVSADGAGLSEVTVTLTNAQADSFTLETTTNADGYYAFHDVPYGTYRVTISGDALNGMEIAEPSALVEVGTEVPAVANFNGDPATPTSVTVSAIGTTSSTSTMMVTIIAAVLMLATIALWRRPDEQM